MAVCRPPWKTTSSGAALALRHPTDQVDRIALQGNRPLFLEVDALRGVEDRAGGPSQGYQDDQGGGGDEEHQEVGQPQVARLDGVVYGYRRW